ncbi:hypothetical protein AB0B79_09360 [Streptomyces sp. NPDC039022]|uniref:hypothetical protein n=1 Tax=unclassified Streptomyces TaxID=2593676 RepID=UPI003403A385
MAVKTGPAVHDAAWWAVLSVAAVLDHRDHPRARSPWDWCCRRSSWPRWWRAAASGQGQPWSSPTGCARWA